jgi:hypothetical protein
MSTTRLHRYFYSDAVGDFLTRDETTILGRLARDNTFALDPNQRDAWLAQIAILKNTLSELNGEGQLYFEYSIPRLGKRVDVVLILGPVVFVIEFKVGESSFPAHAIDQVWDYALDSELPRTSHNCTVAPILVATEVDNGVFLGNRPDGSDQVLAPIGCGPSQLAKVLSSILTHAGATGSASGSLQVIDPHTWESGRYAPTPTIIEAATALYSGHSVADISRSDASAINLTSTTDAIESAIRSARDHRRKVVCFVTGVPGAGKTLVGLNVATKHTRKDEDLYSVFLSGNGPLVAILREALARDKVRHQRELGNRIKKGVALSEVKAFIQNVHHFRDECLIDARSTHRARRDL